MPVYNLITPTDRKLSCEALGVLGTMLNVPENDYITDKELHNAIPADSIAEIRHALSELVSKGYVIQLDNSTYAVNKLKIPHMKII